jgi:hypothetical protein
MVSRFVRRVPAVALLAALVSTGCEALIPYNWHSAELDDERFALVVEPAEPAAPPLQVVLPRDGVHPSLRVDPLWFQMRFEELLAHNVIAAPRAPSMWGARAAADFFAEPPRIVDAAARGSHGALFEVRPGVKGFRLERWLGKDLVTVLEFSVEPRGDACLVTLERISCVDCRAKVADKSWINFWARIPCIYGFWFDLERLFSVSYGDNAVDMRVDLVFQATWSDTSGEGHSAPLAVVGWTVPDVPLGKPIELHQPGGWLPFVPLSASLGTAGAEEFGRGHFVVEGYVTEQDDLSPAYMADRESLGQYFDDILGLIPGTPTK